MAWYGYIRVSTTKQDGDGQVFNVVQRFPDCKIVFEQGSGGAKNPAFSKLLKSLKTGDHLVVYSLDRLGRKAKNLLELFEYLLVKKINLISIKEGIDLLTPSGRLMAQVLASVAEFEREITSERITASLAARKAKGLPCGPEIKVTPAKEAEILRMRNVDNKTIREIAIACGLSYGAVQKVVANAKRYPRTFKAAQKANDHSS